MHYIPKVVSISLFCLTAFALPPGYEGKPFRDKNHQSGPQVIPGIVECALYDLGGEGVAYHDVDPENIGAQYNHREFKTQPKDGTQGVVMKQCRPGTPEYICFFRENEGVDISHTKDFSDYDHHSNLFDPPKKQLYIGWEEDGEWTNYTVNVKVAGTYVIKALYSNLPLIIKFSVDGKPAAACQLPTKTSNMHVWNKAECGEITFSKAGLQLLTMRYNQGTNLASFEFVRKSPRR